MRDACARRQITGEQGPVEAPTLRCGGIARASRLDVEVDGIGVDERAEECGVGRKQRLEPVQGLAVHVLGDVARRDDLDAWPDTANGFGRGSHEPGIRAGIGKRAPEPLVPWLIPDLDGADRARSQAGVADQKLPPTP